MKKEQIYRTPELVVSETMVEQGFAASSSTIENPNESAEDPGYWN